MMVRQIITEVLNEGIEGSLKPNDYAKGKIETALLQLRQMVGELKIAEPQDRYYTSRIDQEAHYENLRWNEALDCVMEKMR